MASRAAIGMKVEGVEEARAALERILRAQSGAIPAVLKVVGEQWITEIRRFAPLKTGRLRRSYTYEVGPGYVEASSNVIYAPYQEYGTVRISGTPHVRPGTDAVIGKVPDLIVEGMSRASGGLGAGAGALGGLARLKGAAARLGSLGG